MNPIWIYITIFTTLSIILFISEMIVMIIAFVHWRRYQNKKRVCERCSHWRHTATAQRSIGKCDNVLMYKFIRMMSPEVMKTYWVKDQETVDEIQDSLRFDGEFSCKFYIKK